MRNYKVQIAGMVNILPEDCFVSPKKRVENNRNFLTMVTIAEADGEIDDKEMAILKEVGMKLGVRLSDYGLE